MPSGGRHHSLHKVIQKFIAEQPHPHSLLPSNAWYENSIRLHALHSKFWGRGNFYWVVTRAYRLGCNKGV